MIKAAVFFGFVIVCAKIAQSRIWPWGIAHPWLDRNDYVAVDHENDSLQIKHGRVKKIFERVEEGHERLLKGPETLTFSNEGTLHALNEEGFLISLTDIEDVGDGVTMTAKTTVVADLGSGRPLGGRFGKDDTLYIADAHLGLTRLKDVGSKDSKVELVASRFNDNGNWSQILYANDVTIGPKTGSVYFTDSSEIAPERIGTRTWDTMYAAKTDLMRGAKTGRLLRYDPSTDQVEVLARDLHFSNGIAVDKDETSITFVETFTLRLLKYDLESGELSTSIDGKLTGYPDGLDCAWKGVTSTSTDLCYAAMPSAIVPLMKLASKIPHPFDIFFRSFLMSLPKAIAPPVQRYGGLVEFDKDKGFVRFIQDPTGADVGMLTGVTVYDNKLYLGSLQNDFVGVYHL